METLKAQLSRTRQMDSLNDETKVDPDRLYGTYSGPALAVKQKATASPKGNLVPVPFIIHSLSKKESRDDSR